MVTIALVDDTIMFRKLLADCINKWYDFNVILQADNGVDLMNQLNHSRKNLPMVALLDIQMPVMNGFETAEQLHKQYPQINMLALSQFCDVVSVKKMITKGALGFITKYAEPSEIKQAISTVAQGEYYFNNLVSESIVNNITVSGKKILAEREILLIKFCATDMPVKQMAEKLNTGIKNINKIKHHLFLKFNVTNRSGLVSAAIKNKIISETDL